MALMAPDDLMQVAIGIDVGGTALKFGLVSKTGESVYDGSVDTDVDEGRAGIQRGLKHAVQELSAKARSNRHRVVAAGIGIPGTVHQQSGVILTSPNQIPGLQKWRVAASLQKLTGVPSVADNDATAAGLAEFHAGAGRGVESLLLITLGTGMGGALVTNGKIVRGAYGTGGEVGHVVYEPNGLPCGHGHGTGRGCFELYASATALVRIYRDHGGAKGLSAKDIVLRARKKERRALKALHQVGTALGIGLASIATVTAPELILIGGGLSAAGSLIIKPAREAMKLQALPYVAKAKIRRASLGNQAGYVGAGLLAFQEL